MTQVLSELKRRRDRNKLKYYKPYGKQKVFHEVGAKIRERLFMAGNQLGKTWSSAYEIAMHLTGQYPDWWAGKRWSRATVGWALGITNETVRDTLQRLLLGRPGEWGTGTIPSDCVLDIKRAQGISDAVDTVLVRHVSGGISRISFKSYERGRSKLQGETIDFAALDEEPPLDVYMEVMTRTNATKGLVWTTFTPLLGMSEVVRRFLQEESPDREVIKMTIHDVEHYNEEEKQRIIDSYPAHEREARAMGIPILGSGRVFPIAENQLRITWEELPMIPDHWPRICGLDYGWDHPTAAAWLAWDRDNDTIYLYDAYRAKGGTPATHAGPIRARGPWIPAAWPKDGLQHEKGSGIQLTELYRREGINMLFEAAQFEESASVATGQQTYRYSVEAGVMEMLDYMQKGKFRVYDHLADWWEEFRLYHRKDGKIVAMQDDLISAVRYAFVMRRYAQVPPVNLRQVRPNRDYDWIAG